MSRVPRCDMTDLVCLATTTDRVSRGRNNTPGLLCRHVRPGVFGRRGGPGLLGQDARPGLCSRGNGPGLLDRSVFSLGPTSPGCHRMVWVQPGRGGQIVPGWCRSKHAPGVRLYVTPGGPGRRDRPGIDFFHILKLGP